VSVLLVAPAGAAGDAVVTRLLDAGDEVRIVAAGSEDVERWRSQGAHIARGDPRDDDLIERAAQNTRSIVVFVEETATQETLTAALAGATAAGVERLIVLCRALRPEVQATVARAPLDYLLLVTGLPLRRRISLRPSPTPEAVARAVDAADDVAGHPRSVLDLRRAKAWRALKLDPPGS
jgi:hypothetical protein